ncbi:hypothetical protein FB451DRAFT_1170232 [Mycena latifolia]|nr:hypothetical protein FB451DRAFT_1170232 [Mycena latifolia]
MASSASRIVGSPTAHPRQPHRPAPYDKPKVWGGLLTVPSMVMAVDLTGNYSYSTRPQSGMKEDNESTFPESGDSRHGTEMPTHAKCPVWAVTTLIRPGYNQP